MMRIEPNQISHRLAAMLLKVGRGDLTRTGFDVHEDALERSKRHESDPDRALFHALFDKGAPHNAPGLISGVKAWAQEVSYVQFMLTVLVVLVATQSARCQPSQNLVVRGQNGSTTQFTRSAGLLDFKCDGSTVICSWNSSTSTWTITAAGGGGGTPGGANCDVQYNNSGAFGGASDWCFDAATGTVSLTPSLSLPAANLSGYSGENIAFTVSGAHDNSLFNLNGLNVDLELNQTPGVVDDSGLQPVGANVVVNMNAAEAIYYLIGVNGFSNMYHGTASFNSGLQFLAQAFNEADVTSQMSGIYVQAAAFTNSKISGNETGIEVGYGGDTGAPIESGIQIDDDFGCPAGSSCYAIYSLSVDPSVFTGSVAIDGTASVGGLSIAGHACTLVAGVPHCP